MIDIKHLLKNKTDILKRLNRRHTNWTPTIETVIALRQKHLNIRKESEQLAHELNLKNKQISNSPPNTKTLKFLKTQKKLLQTLLQEEKKLRVDLTNHLIQIPNIPHDSVPSGKNATENRVTLISSLPIKKFALPHWEIAQKLQWVDWIIPGQNVQSRFVIYKNEGARLLRTLQNFCLDFHRFNHYQEFFAPNLIKEKALYGTGQFPKMLNDCYKIENQDLYLLPTAEVALINYHANKIFAVNELPQKMCGYSLCFRKEAGAAGKDTRGLIRLHQFHKVEMVKFTTPESSHVELEKMVKEARTILKLLEIPYRVIELCTGDLGFASAKTFDLEVWMPSQKKYVEIASLSNTESFQARKLNIKMKNSITKKKVFLHTLNGSGLALDRLFACLLETYYNKTTDTVHLPKALENYQNNSNYFSKTVQK